MTFVDSKSRFLHKTLQADVANRAGRLRDYLCRPRSQSKLLRRPAVEVWESTTKPASSFSSFVVSAQTKISERFCWTSADVCQEETCEHPTCRRHLLPLPSPAPQGAPAASSADCGLAPACRGTRLWRGSRFLHQLSSLGFIKLPGRKTRPASHKPSQTVLLIHPRGRPVLDQKVNCCCCLQINSSNCRTYADPAEL